MGVKHLIECHCILPQFKKKQPPIYHKFTVYSKFNSDTGNVIEKYEQPGGKASLLEKDGFAFDMGPSWYMWPQVFENFFSEFGMDASEELELEQLDPSYRVFFSDGDTIDVSSDVNKNYELLLMFDVNQDDAETPSTVEKYKSIEGVSGIHLMGYKQEKEIASVISHFK